MRTSRRVSLSRSATSGTPFDSVASLKLKGLDNGRLYREVAVRYELFFTKDREFAERVVDLNEPGPVKIVLTILRQQPQAQFVAAFMAAFVVTDWPLAALVHEWPAR
jgi:hypothetical protein